MDPAEDINFDEINHSELVELCHWLGETHVSRGWSRDQIIRCLTKMSFPKVASPIDNIRERMKSFQELWWDRIRMQAAKKVCPKCHECRDSQVLFCFDKNRAHFE